jgi:hypothetical protein
VHCGALFWLNKHVRASSMHNPKFEIVGDMGNFYVAFARTSA